MRITAIVAVSAALAAAGCLGGEEGPKTVTPIAGHGLRALAPDSWNGRVTWLDPTYAITLEAATVDLPPAGAGFPGDLLGEGETYVAVNDIGPLPATFSGRAGSWAVDPEGPLGITAEGVLGPFQGGFAAGASLNVVIEGRALMIFVGFGSWPGPDEIDEVNELLGSLAVAPRASRK